MHVVTLNVTNGIRASFTALIQPVLQMYYVYILQSEKDHTYYTGITKDLSDRLHRHNSGWEKYTKIKAPWSLVWYTIKPNRAEASKLERKLKNLKSGIRVKRFIQKYSQ